MAKSWMRALAALALGASAIGVVGAETRPVYQPSSAPLRVALLGTSLTKRGGWDTALEERLSACLGRPVETLNFGGAGMNSRWGLAQVETVLAEAPDVVSIEFSANDASILRGVGLDESAANAKAIIERLGAGEKPPKRVLLAMNPMHGVRSWVRPWLDDYYDAYPALAAKTGAVFLDLRPHWRALGPEALSEAIPDGVHPTPEASAAVAAAPLAKAIAAALGAKCREPE